MNEGQNEIIPSHPTFRRIYRAPRFFICVSQSNQPTTTLEPKEERLTKFIFFSYGEGIHYYFKDGEVRTYNSGTESAKDLYDLKPFADADLVVQNTKGNGRIIAFNTWKKEEDWNGKLLRTTQKKIISKQSYSCLVALEGSCTVNGVELEELSYIDLQKDVEYQVNITKGNYIALFECMTVDKPKLTL